MRKFRIINEIMVVLVLFPLCAFASIHAPNRAHLKLDLEGQGKSQGWKIDLGQTKVVSCPTKHHTVYSLPAMEYYGDYGKVSSCAPNIFSKSKSMQYVTELSLINSEKNECKLLITVKCHHSPVTWHVTDCRVEKVTAELSGSCAKLKDYYAVTDIDGTNADLLINVPK